MTSKLLEGFIGRAYRLHVNGPLTSKLTNALASGLQSSWPYRPLSLLVSINSTGGSLTQARNITDLLRHYSNKHNIPVVTFVEDQCLGSANLVLAAGVKSYAHGFSAVGDYGFVWSRMWYQKLAEEYGIKRERLGAGRNDLSLDQYAPMPQSTQKWFKNLAFEQQHQLQSAVIAFRADAISKRKTDRNQLLSALSSGLIDPDHACKIGLLDGVRSIDQQIQERYPNTKIHEINKPKKTLGGFSLEELKE